MTQVVQIKNGQTFEQSSVLIGSEAKNSVGIGPESNTASVTIPNLKSGLLIPSWIKTNAQWWSQDKISDSEYVMAIEFLINEGIIKLK
ncbi:MAG: hypothetical protein P8X78_01375 [Nitrosopumilaceae archaeon]